MQAFTVFKLFIFVTFSFRNQMTANAESETKEYTNNTNIAVMQLASLDPSLKSSNSCGSISSQGTAEYTLFFFSFFLFCYKLFYKI